MPAPYSDPALQYLSINDFSHGVKRWDRAGSGYTLTYRPGAPLGSAATAYRCFGKPEIGLLPFADYSQIALTHTATDPSNPVALSMGNMKSLASRGAAVGDIVSAVLIQHGHPEVRTDFQVTRLPVTHTTFTPTVLYTSSQTTQVGTPPAAFPGSTSSWPMMDYGTFQDPSSNLYARTVITTDPISTSLVTNPGGPGKWITVRGWTTPTGTTAPESSTGTFATLGAIGGYPRVFYHANRMGIWQVGSAQTVTNGFVSTDNDVLQVSNLLNPSTINNAGTFFPEMGTFIGSWGSISTGEFVGIYAEGGAVLIYGDLFAPTQVIKLPGVIGTLGCVCPGALTPVGMIYPTANEGAYLWNGDNTSQKISEGIPENDFVRYVQSNGFRASSMVQSSTAVMVPFVFFPNNWVYDTSTNAWWQSESTAIINFQVFCLATSWLVFASPGVVYANAGQTATLNTYQFDKGSPASSYYWLSNPIPVTQDSLVSIQLVELVASNTTPTPCTVTIQPTAPAGQLALPQQNGTQQVTFTVPANTVAYRASQRLGYSDYNIQLALTVTNTNSNNAACVVHQINVGYTTTRTAGIQ